MTRGVGHGIDQYQRASLLLPGPMLFHSLLSVNYKLLRDAAAWVFMYTGRCRPRDNDSPDWHIVINMYTTLEST